MGDLVKFDAARARAEKTVTEPDERLVVLLEGLREFTDTVGKQPALVLKDGVYRGRNLDKRINSVKYDGVEIGYRLREIDNGMYRREVFLHFEQPIRTIPDESRDPILLAVFDAFLQEGQGPVGMRTFRHGNIKRRNRNTHDCIRISQDFSPILLTRTETAKTHITINDDIEKLLGGN